MRLQLPGNLGSLDFADWLYGLLSGFISGGATTVVAMFTAVISDPEHFRPGSHTFYKLLLNVFVASGLINAMNFLRTKPLPAMRTTETTVQKTEILPSKPPATVVTTVKETIVEPTTATTSAPVIPAPPAPPHTGE